MATKNCEGGGMGGTGMDVEGKGVMVAIFYGMLPQFNIIMI